MLLYCAAAAAMMSAAALLICYFDAVFDACRYYHFSRFTYAMLPPAATARYFSSDAAPSLRHAMLIFAHIITVNIEMPLCLMPPFAMFEPPLQR